MNDKLMTYLIENDRDSIVETGIDLAVALSSCANNAILVLDGIARNVTNKVRDEFIEGLTNGDYSPDQYSDMLRVLLRKVIESGYVEQSIEDMVNTMETNDSAAVGRARMLVLMASKVSEKGVQFAEDEFNSDNVQSILASVYTDIDTGTKIKVKAILMEAFREHGDRIIENYLDDLIRIRDRMNKLNK